MAAALVESMQELTLKEPEVGSKDFESSALFFFVRAFICALCVCVFLMQRLVLTSWHCRVGLTRTLATT